MSSAADSRDLLLHEFRSRLLPWAQEKSALVSLAEPPFSSTGPLKTRRFSVGPLPSPAQKKSYLNALHWPEHTLVAKPFPYLGCVLEGTADLRCTAALPLTDGASSKSTRRSTSIHVLTLPEKNFLAIPAGVPHSDGKVPHWEGPHPENAFSRILWILVLPAGILCHVCTTNGEVHDSICPLFIHDSHLSAVAELLIEELRTRRNSFEAAAWAQLTFLLLRTERGLQSQEPLATGKGIRLFPPETAPVLPHSTNQTLELACRYIQTHLEEPLTPAQIAENAHVSVSHLNRLFRAELGLSVMNFVSSCRLEMAKSMLENTDLPMATVGRLTGFYDAAHLTHTFRRAVGLSPSSYRANFRGPARRMIS